MPKTQTAQQREEKKERACVCVLGGGEGLTQPALPRAGLPRRQLQHRHPAGHIALARRRAVVVREVVPRPGRRRGHSLHHPLRNVLRLHLRTPAIPPLRHTLVAHQTRRRVPRQKTKQGLGLAGSAPNWRERGESCTSTQCSESGFLGFFTSVRGEFARGECAGSRRAAGRLLGENGAGERGGESSVAEPRAEVDSTAPTETDVGRPRLVRSGV